MFCNAPIAGSFHPAPRPGKHAVRPRASLSERLSLMEITNRPAPVYIGLRRKARCPRPPTWCDHPQAEQVVEICSVSNCIAGGPEILCDTCYNSVYWTDEKSIDAWSWTALDLAEQAILREACNDLCTADQLDLCAYRVFPWRFGRDASPVVLEPRQLFAEDYALPLPAPDWADFERLGYDVVQFEPARLLDRDGGRRSDTSLASFGYGCSPLSCNGLACEYPVNRCCLFDEIGAAYEAGLAFGREEPEPAPYAIVEVLRQRGRAGGRRGPAP